MTPVAEMLPCQFNQSNIHNPPTKGGMLGTLPSSVLAKVYRSIFLRVDSEANGLLFVYRKGCGSDASDLAFNWTFVDNQELDDWDSLQSIHLEWLPLLAQSQDFLKTILKYSVQEVCVSLDIEMKTNIRKYKSVVAFVHFILHFYPNIARIF